MPYRNHEPSLAELLSDPIAQAVMAADGVDPQLLRAKLSEVARRRHDSDARPLAPVARRSCRCQEARLAG
jgi:hypothetical protein